MDWDVLNSDGQWNPRKSVYFTNSTVVFGDNSHRNLRTSWSLIGRLRVNLMFSTKITWTSTGLYHLGTTERTCWVLLWCAGRTACRCRSMCLVSKCVPASKCWGPRCPFRHLETLACDLPTIVGSSSPWNKSETGGIFVSFVQVSKKIPTSKYICFALI